MIKKLYNFKSAQLEQQLVQKKQLMAKIFELDEQINQTQKSLSTATVNIFGAIGDFKILAIHKNAMKYELSKFEREKKLLQSQIVSYDKVIMELQKELEQYGYILKEEIRFDLKKKIKAEELVASEYIQAKWAAS
jgi:regulator of replication initiation timing